jgi:hypothetical protein
VTPRAQSRTTPCSRQQSLTRTMPRCRPWRTFHHLSLRKFEEVSLCDALSNKVKEPRPGNERDRPCESTKSQLFPSPVIDQMLTPGQTTRACHQAAGRLSRTTAHPAIPGICGTNHCLDLPDWAAAPHDGCLAVRAYPGLMGGVRSAPQWSWLARRNVRRSGKESATADYAAAAGTDYRMVMRFGLAGMRPLVGAGAAVGSRWQALESDDDLHARRLR